jgi:hypothetical protein
MDDGLTVKSARVEPYVETVRIKGHIGWTQRYMCCQWMAKLSMGLLLNTEEGELRNTRRY